jgi:glycogen(starch) synthase
VAFICVPRDIVRIKPAIVENRAFYLDIQESIGDNIEEAKRRIIRFLISKNTVTEKDLFSKEFLFEMRKKVFRFLKKGIPPLSSHDLPFEDKDQIIKAFREEGLLNREEDKVKVVFYPQYLTGADNLLDLDYNEAIMGAHLGVFPSYYEPWGYTPPETGAMGVAAVTTDNAGFGRYLVSSENTQKKDPGIFVIKTFNKTDDEKVENLFDVLYKYSQYDREERIKNKIEARRLAALADWDKLVHNYLAAYKIAVDKVYPAEKK